MSFYGTTKFNKTLKMQLYVLYNYSNGRDSTMSGLISSSNMFNIHTYTFTQGYNHLFCMGEGGRDGWLVGNKSSREREGCPPCFNRNFGNISFETFW